MLINLMKSNVLKSISFFSLGIIIFTSQILSIAMNVLLIAITSWNLLKKLIKILNIICLVVICLTIFINIIMFCSLKNIKDKIIQKYSGKMVSTIFLIIIYLIIIIFNIYNAIYLSLKLHIADYPEYGGRKRDQAYIDSHPNEFGNVSLKEFIIVAICPSLICVFNLLCIVICFLLRNKIILIYNKENERLHKYNYKDNNKNKKHKNDRKRKNSDFNNIKSSTDFINNNTSPQDINNINNRNNNNIIKIKVNNFDERGDYELKLPKKNISKFKYDTAENSSDENNYNANKYNGHLPDKLFFGGRELKVNEEYKTNYNLDNPNQIKISAI